MDIAIIGAGNIGRTLAKSWLARGHRIRFGMRDVTSDKIKQAKVELGDQIIFQSIPAAVHESSVMVLAIPGKAVSGVINTLSDVLEQHIIIDAANTLDEDVMHSFQKIQEVAPTASLFRAFNSLGWENFATPAINGVQIDHFYCGDEGESQIKVHQLITDIGLNPVYLGGLEHTSTLDALTRLWFTLAFQKGYGRRVVLKILSE